MGAFNRLRFLVFYICSDSACFDNGPIRGRLGGPLSGFQQTGWPSVGARPTQPKVLRPQGAAWGGPQPGGRAKWSEPPPRAGQFWGFKAGRVLGCPAP
jgi:hypothetical protein